MDLHWSGFRHAYGDFKTQKIFQAQQLDGFSSAWILTCLLMPKNSENFYSQAEQLNGFPSEWIIPDYRLYQTYKNGFRWNRPQRPKCLWNSFHPFNPHKPIWQTKRLILLLIHNTMILFVKLVTDLITSVKRILLCFHFN